MQKSCEIMEMHVQNLFRVDMLTAWCTSFLGRITHYHVSWLLPEIDKLSILECFIRSPQKKFAFNSNVLIDYLCRKELGRKPLESLISWVLGFIWRKCIHSKTTKLKRKQPIDTAWVENWWQLSKNYDLRTSSLSPQVHAVFSLHSAGWRRRH